MTQHDPRLQEAAAKLTEGFLLALTALNTADAPAEPPAEAVKPEAKKAEPKAEPAKPAAEPEGPAAEAEAPSADDLKKALIAATEAHGKPEALAALQSVVDGATKIAHVPEKDRTAVIAALEAI